MDRDYIEENYYELRQLFSGYFNPEWDEEHDTEEEVVFDFAKYRDNDRLLDTLLEIEKLKKEFPEDDKLKEAIEDDLCLSNGLSLDYLKLTGEQWLAFVESIIKRELNNRKNKT